MQEEEEKRQLDCKFAHPHLTAAAQTFVKVDIKVRFQLTTRSLPEETANIWIWCDRDKSKYNLTRYIIWSVRLLSLCNSLSLFFAPLLLFSSLGFRIGTSFSPSLAFLLQLHNASVSTLYPVLCWLSVWDLSAGYVGVDDLALYIRSKRLVPAVSINGSMVR